MIRFIKQSFYNILGVFKGIHGQYNGYQPTDELDRTNPPRADSEPELSKNVIKKLNSVRLMGINGPNMTVQGLYVKNADGGFTKTNDVNKGKYALCLMFNERDDLYEKFIDIDLLELINNET